MKSLKNAFIVAWSQAELLSRIGIILGVTVLENLGDF